ncbi:hypothetical protein AVEN_234774-1 [Araneus ventricosus]|uniref:Uncharacterized protein n=1 Tax=Araneus ventricosus TaxID=182803 RepID=A0A4Y2M0Y4_ARAVE|nr:hypothetical protein AVEN_234774-1 [Araneus ventricosus]
MSRTTPKLAPLSSPIFRRLPTYDLMCNRQKYMVDLSWNRVSNLEPSGPDAVETITVAPLKPVMQLWRQFCIDNTRNLSSRPTIYE